MNNAHPKISTKASPDAETLPPLGAGADGLGRAPEIRQLSEATINRIAAGEVVERPASALKELVENALDAGARRVDIAYADGGKTLIRVMDDGCGMSAADLPLALSRHATSKLNADDLLDIHSFGFRGEALPSLGAVGRLTITSRPRGGGSAHQITVNGSVQGDVRPAAGQFGTLIELRDLFYATPARLKFLRTDRAEASAILDVVKRLAMAEPFVAFTLRDVSGSAGAEGRLIFRADAENGDLFDALHGRLRTVLGRDFAENALKIDALRDGVHLSGYAALPTYSRGAAVEQFMFVNGRPVRDKVLLGALRAAYFDFLSRDRHPAACLFIDCDPQWVDVNVHPAKSEVRFREPALVRGLIVSGLRAALAEAGHRASTTVSNATLGAFRAEIAPNAGQNAGLDAPRFQMPLGGTGGYAPRTATPQFSEQAGAFAGWDAPSTGLMDAGDMASARVDAPVAAPEVQALPLGAARAQVHENYIISQTENGIVIVDAHAAHERLVYERLKAQMAANTVRAQALLIPEIVELSAGDCAMLIEAAPGLERLGLTIEPFGGTAIAVRETPAILGQVNARALVLDIVDELSDLGVSTGLEARLEAVLSRVACHGSVRTGRHLRVEEMNALLREMEATPHSGQCNHGRPTYVALKLTDIERLFGRS